MGASSYRASLRQALSGETKAYGFTLVVWGTGALAMAEHGNPGRSGAIAYVAGTLLAMTAVILLAFGGPAGRWESSGRTSFGLGGIHVVSVPVSVAVGWALAALLGPHWAAFGAAGFGAVMVFQLLLGLEVAVSSPNAGERPSR